MEVEGWGNRLYLKNKYIIVNFAFMMSIFTYIYIYIYIFKSTKESHNYQFIWPSTALSSPNLILKHLDKWERFLFIFPI